MTIGREGYERLREEGLLERSSRVVGARRNLQVEDEEVSLARPPPPSNFGRSFGEHKGNLVKFVET